MLRLLYMAFFLMAFALASNPLFAQISNPEGKLTKSTADDIWPQTMTGSHFNEFWTYHFFLEDDIRVHITFSVANFGSLKSPVSGVRISVLGVDNRVRQLSREYPIERLVLDRENHMMRLHPDRDVWFAGKLPDQHEVRINTSKDGINYDIHLTLSNIVPGYRWGDGKFTVRNEQIGIITHIPYAEVTGHVALNDNRREVRGTAYMDHTYQNQTTTRLMDSGYRFVSHTDRNNWDLVYFLLPEGQRGNKNTIGYRLVRNDGKTRISGAVRIDEMTENRTFDKNLAQMIYLKTDNSQPLRITRTFDEERFSLLQELSRVARMAARRFLGGEVIEFRGTATMLIPGSLPAQGYYNYFIVE